MSRTERNPDKMDAYKKDALNYLAKLEALCKWLDTVKFNSSYSDFVKAGIITRGELRDKNYLGLRRDIVFWGNHGWTRTKDWETALENKRQDILSMEDEV
ncbi:MAG: hypothetical protein HGA22_11870 [Clostridiales bacterium]|nr:hypothetical protein [Clostridiales bacterium]